MKWIPQVIPIFPLPDVVFFPETFLPLHIFEPRYRQMVQDCLEDRPFIGMALLREGWEPNYYGAPPVYPLGCVGEIIHSEKLSDGRYNIVLRGLKKYEILEELFHRSYRQALVGFRDLPEEEASLPESVREELESLMRRYSRLIDQEIAVDNLLAMGLESTALLNTLSSVLPLPPGEKYFLLESENPSQHCGRLLDLLRFNIIALQGGRGPSGPPLVH
ncbi:MAG: LON peptidase substrate-binding domain-containing protein [Candidatus Tectomicrobia bacterium]|uniref:LON peptidase substrate-binding domain-containing protein n=1 Tax=Tectimicrobiota bacterium TaxID=2528274 RepID=A0A932LZR3_UNCTE|nr:LON peptidase substrate-binding domain-containing protein [Candidatus Tectomicrobia bacterium]